MLKIPLTLRLFYSRKMPSRTQQEGIFIENTEGVGILVIIPIPFRTELLAHQRRWYCIPECGRVGRRQLNLTNSLVLSVG